MSEYFTVEYAYGQPADGADVLLVRRGEGTVRLTPNSFYRVLADLAPLSGAAREAWWAKLREQVERRSPTETL